MYEYNCRIVRVVDGDTVDVDIDLGFSHWIHDERIRLYGVDSSRVPQHETRKKKQQDSCREGLCQGSAARSAGHTPSPQEKRESSDDT
jgi:hypothetical protein